jgi:hypothetical protein
MRLERVANWATILALIPGFFCAYCSYALLRQPRQIPAISPPPNAAMNLKAVWVSLPSAAVNLKVVLVSLLLAVALVFLASILNMIAVHRRRASTQSNIQTVSKPLVGSGINTSTVNFDATEFFKHAYVSHFREETESNIRAAAIQNQPNDREGFYVKLISVGLVGYMYDVAWAYIYRSQLLMLLDLNRRILSLVEVKAYYDKAAKDNRAFYAHYSFDRWLAFLKSHVLLIQHPKDTVEITVRGKDFLKYLVHYGRYPDDRRL